MTECYRQLNDLKVYDKTVQRSIDNTLTRMKVTLGIVKKYDNILLHKEKRFNLQNSRTSPSLCSTFYQSSQKIQL